ncbi:hypothetical protein C1645_832704 [Glomus cerebriforme]|uniref:BTB domain-containing protein n=1 Tax=Glomus cerebriforme TaxID=658196 RepID=A0A397SD01_9GLOM|nr:hypothetical protein C1645_832704 [Glomus cerebriforme]
MANFHRKLISNYENLYKTKEGYDVIIYVGEILIKEFRAHSLILKTHSKFFKRNLTKSIRKITGRYLTINLRYSPDLFEILLSYMYCGSIDLMKLQPIHKILDLLLISDELELQPLVEYFQEILIDHRVFVIRNILEIIELTYQKDSLDKLWNYCLQQICYEPDYLFKSTRFFTFNQSILEILLKRDDFYVSNEIIIWKNLLKWACGQNPIIKLDINRWNKNEFMTMKKRLSRFIPLIRFYHISSEDFLLKVYPFKEILPRKLIDNMLAYHMVPKEKFKIINISPQRFTSRLPRYVWDKFASGTKLIIDDDEKSVGAKNDCNSCQNVRAQIRLEDSGIFEWDIIIEKTCSFAWVGVCASENFNYETFAGYQSTGWVLGSNGYCWNSAKSLKYCPSFINENGVKITVRLNMIKRTCAFTINNIKYPEVLGWNNLPSKLYLVVSLCHPGHFRIHYRL